MLELVQLRLNRCDESWRNYLAGGPLFEAGTPVSGPLFEAADTFKVSK